MWRPRGASSSACWTTTWRSARPSPTTNAIESLNARYRRAVRARGHFPTDRAALKYRYLVTRSLDPTGRRGARWVIRWKAALNAFAITFDGPINPSNHSHASQQLHRSSDRPRLDPHDRPGRRSVDCRRGRRRSVARPDLRTAQRLVADSCSASLVGSG